MKKILILFVCLAGLLACGNRNKQGETQQSEVTFEEAAINILKLYQDVNPQLATERNELYQLMLKHTGPQSEVTEADKTYLDEILLKDDPNIILDEEQRKVVLSDEDYTLVIAGAGAGKTTTIEAKVKYLVEKQNVDADKILIVSFTRKATEELKERFKRLELDVNIETFHSIGNTIIKENEPVRHRIVSTGYMYDKIREYLTTKLDDEYFIKKILLFFASYLNMPFDETNTTLLFKSLKDDNIQH